MIKPQYGEPIYAVLRRSMEKLQPLLDEWAARISTRVRVEPTNIIHLPSLLLGCFLTVTVSVLVPLMKLFLGGLLLTVVTLLKYLVICGGTVALIMLLTLGSSKGNRNKSAMQEAPIQLRKSKPPLPPRSRPVSPVPPSSPQAGPSHAMVYPPSDGTGLVKDDFEEIKHYDIPVAKSQRRNRQLDEHAYNSFINRAALNGVNC
ncbi:YOR097C [Zygosaccharomyces parabailii]|nr:YOR097C [Zygosaccharomyces parabailii]